MKAKRYPIWRYKARRTVYHQPYTYYFYSRKEAEEHARVFQSDRYEREVKIEYLGAFTAENAYILTGKKPKL